MLKAQRERLGQFKADLQKIIDTEGIDKLANILGVTKPTIKKWLQGKENGGTEPPSSDYDGYEKKLAAHFASIKRAAGSKKAAAERATQAAQIEIHKATVQSLHAYASYALLQGGEKPLMQKLADDLAFVISISNEYKLSDFEDFIPDLTKRFETALQKEYSDLTKDAIEAGVTAAEVAVTLAIEPASDSGEGNDDELDELVRKNSIRNEATMILLSCETLLKMPISFEKEVALKTVIGFCEVTLEMPLMDSELELMEMQLANVKERYYAVKDTIEIPAATAEALPDPAIIDITPQTPREDEGDPTMTKSAVLEVVPAKLPVAQATTIRLDLLDANPFQPRQVFSDETIAELARSIQENGLLQLPVVRKVGERYQLIAGERRTRAVRTLGWTELTVNVVDMTDAQVAAAALVENFQREDVSALETARAVDRLVRELGMKQGEIAERMGVTQAKISQMLSLLKLTKPYLRMLEENEISPSIGRIIAGLSEEGQKGFDPKKIAESNVKNVQRWVNSYKMIEAMIDGAGTEIQADDPLRLKFIKFMRAKDLIDVFKTWDGCYNWIDSDNNVSARKDFSGFNFNAWNSIEYEVYSKNQDMVNFLQGALNKNPGGGRVILYLKKKKDIMQDIKAFMAAYCPYEPPKAAQSQSGASEDKKAVATPPAPRMTKEEKQEKIAEAQETSPVQVISISEPAGKGERILQRLQEHQKKPFHDLSNRCYNCKHFKPEEKGYRERCGIEYWNTNNLDRFKVEHKPDLMFCDKYEPTAEQIEKETVDGMDTEAVMLELLLAVMPGRNILDRLMPPTKGKSIPQLIEFFKEMDAKNRAYFLSIVSQRVGIHDSRSVNKKFFFLPSGEKIEVTSALINGADDI